MDVVIDHLNRRQNEVAYQVFADVEPDPSDVTVYKGAELMKDFKPDCIIALGGGSAMDAAKECGFSMNILKLLSSDSSKNSWIFANGR